MHLSSSELKLAKKKAEEMYNHIMFKYGASDL